MRHECFNLQWWSNQISTVAKYSNFGIKIQELDILEASAGININQVHLHFLPKEDLLVWWFEMYAIVEYLKLLCVRKL